MALINATWKVTHAGVVLLDWDDFSDGEPRVQRAFIAVRVAILGGAAQTFLGSEHLIPTPTVRRFGFSMTTQRRAVRAGAHGFIMMRLTIA
jgi:hypothetical protein